MAVYKGRKDQARIVEAPSAVVLRPTGNAARVDSGVSSVINQTKPKC